jgi:hypothetical protein
MVFGFFKRTPKVPKKEPDALELFEQVIGSVERQGEEIRKAAATLLALRGELTRDSQKYESRIADLEARLPAVEGQLQIETTLRRDLHDSKRLHHQTTEALAQATANAELLMTAAHEVAKQLSELQEERQSARVRFTAGATVSHALQQQARDFDQLMKLDTARDEVERAHALAELYRDDAQK